MVESTLVIPTSHSSIASGALAANGSRGSVTAFTGGSAILAFTRIRRPITTTMSSATINYSYDPLYRLTAANCSGGKVFTFTYDAVGNRLSEGAPAGVSSYTVDDANRLATINVTINYTWDNNGNLTNNGQGSTYGYDAANRLTALNTSVYTYTYNGLGNCVQQASSIGPISYTLDQAAGLTQVLAEKAGTSTTTYLYGQARIDQQTTSGTDYFLTDALGSVRELANASGNVTLRKSYDPYGQTLGIARAARLLHQLDALSETEHERPQMLHLPEYPERRLKWRQPHAGVIASGSDATGCAPPRPATAARPRRALPARRGQASPRAA